MAEGWVRHLAPTVAVESADTRPAGLSRRAVAAMAEAGADIAVTLCGSTRDEIRVRVEALLATVENK